MICRICKKELHTDKKCIFLPKDPLREFFGWVCEDCFCECMPKDTPWRFLSVCEICKNKRICKGCKRELDVCTICCDDCFWKMEKSKRV